MNKYKNSLLNIPQLNKGTAFTNKERKKFGLLGRLPFRVESLDEQVTRAYAQFKSLKDTSQKRLFLNELYGINQVLFYDLVSQNIEEITPIIYTPHVATNCASFSNEFRRPYGLYISYPDRKHLKEIIDNRSFDDVDLIVATDSQRILGIGDQGVGGIGIPIGKLMLYTLFGGIDPKKTLPIVLDVGTDNEKLLNDPQYLGWRHPRVTGKKYLDFIDDFVSVIKQKLPNVLLQWEDFGKQNASVILDRYRKKICSFNDDIQGTAVVVLAAILAAVKISKQKLSDQRIVILGAGSASIGIADLIVAGMQREGISKQQAQKCFWLLDRPGLLTEESKNITPNQKPYLRITGSRPDKRQPLSCGRSVGCRLSGLDPHSLLGVVKSAKPTILIGCSTAANSFTKEIVKEMAKHVKRPVIFPLSNPTQNSEAKPKDLIKWTDGKALIATGSPFDPVVYKNKKYTIAQCNNALAFPGIGLGVIASKAREVTDEMLWVAVEAIYKQAPCLKNPNHPLLPSIKDAASVSKEIGKRVAKTALESGLSKLPTDTNVSRRIVQNTWEINHKKTFSNNKLFKSGYIKT